MSILSIMVTSSEEQVHRRVKHKFHQFSAIIAIKMHFTLDFVFHIYRVIILSLWEIDLANEPMAVLGVHGDL